MTNSSSPGIACCNINTSVTYLLAQEVFILPVPWTTPRNLMKHNPVCDTEPSIQREVQDFNTSSPWWGSNLNTTFFASTVSSLFHCLLQWLHVNAFAMMTLTYYHSQCHIVKVAQGRLLRTSFSEGIKEIAGG